MRPFGYQFLVISQYLLMRVGCSRMFRSIVITLIVTVSLAEDITPTHGQASTSSNGAKRSGDIVKPALDRRLYRGLLLENGMKVLLVSDPSTSKAAASMAVGVGALNDFSNIPGLANLVANLLIEGSVKYPDMNDFVAFLTKFGGNTEHPATTGGDQAFCFNIDPSQLKEALLRFVQFFLEPLLAHSSRLRVEDAVELIDCDYRDQKKTDFHRIAEVEKSISKELHRYRHFFNGNYETLYMHANHLQNIEQKSKSLLERAKAFYRMFYSSSIMTLVVLGKETLEELEEMVVPLFIEVKRQNVVPIEYKSIEHHPWGAAQLKHKIYVVPLTTPVHMVRLNFPFPNFCNRYKKAPDVLIAYILNHRAPRSLASTIRSEGYGNLSNVEYRCCPSGIAFLNICCIVTEKGLLQVDDVVHLIFQYIHFMSNNKEALERMYHEKRMLQKIAFHESAFSYEEPSSYVKTLARAMQVYPVEDILSQSYLLQDRYEPSVVEEFLTYLTPDNMNVTIVSPLFASIKGLQTEKYYGSEYQVEKIPEEVLKIWRRAEAVPTMSLPPKNDLIPEHLYMYKVEKNDRVDPRIIRKSSLSELWFKQNDHLNTYRAHIDIEIFSSLPRLGVSELIEMQLFEMMMSGLHKVYLHSAAAAGVDIQTASDEHSILFKINGFADSLPSVIWRLFYKVNYLRIDEIVDKRGFEVIRQLYIDKLVAAMKKHSNQLVWYMQDFKTIMSYSRKVTLYVAKRLRFDQMKKFLTKVFRRIYIRVFAHGNCSRQKALEMATILEKSFPNSQGMLPQEIVRPRTVDVEEGSHFVRQVFNKTPAVYGYNSYYQLNTRPTYLNNVAGSVLFNIIMKSCEQIMPDWVDRPKKPSRPPLKVKCTIEDLYGAQGLLIQSTTKKNPRSMDLKIEQFVNSIPEIMHGTSTNEFERLRKLAESTEYKEATGLVELSKRYWYEIRYGFQNFLRSEEERDALAALQMADVTTFFREVFGDSASRRRKLAVHLFPSGSEGATLNLPTKAVKVEDISTFRAASTLLPL